MRRREPVEVDVRKVAPRGEGIAQFLRRCPLLAGVAGTTLAALERCAMERDVRHGEPVVEQGADWEGFGLVWSGTLTAVIASSLGREHALFDILSTEPFGEVATIDGGATFARYVAASDSARVVLFPQSIVRSALQEDLAFARAMNALCAQRLRAVIGRFAAQTSLPALVRVAQVLLLHARPERGLQSVLPSLRSITQGEIATAAGTVKEVVNRALAELESAGAIERSGGRIVKIDRERLCTFL
jgi:CRP-like cAMP-binding protein